MVVAIFLLFLLGRRYVESLTVVDENVCVVICCRAKLLWQ
jgi:hypothetical protein